MKPVVAVAPPPPPPPALNLEVLLRPQGVPGDLESLISSMETHINSAHDRQLRTGSIHGPELELEKEEELLVEDGGRSSFVLKDPEAYGFTPSPTMPNPMPHPTPSSHFAISQRTPAEPPRPPTPPQVSQYKTALSEAITTINTKVRRVQQVAKRRAQESCSYAALILLLAVRQPRVPDRDYDHLSGHKQVHGREGKRARGPSSLPRVAGGRPLSASY